MTTGQFTLRRAISGDGYIGQVLLPNGEVWRVQAQAVKATATMPAHFLGTVEPVRAQGSFVLRSPAPASGQADMVAELEGAPFDDSDKL